MTILIFKNWLNNLNMKTKSKNKRILLLLDNAPVHPVDTVLSNIKLLYFPPNTTSLIQPCDQGVIRSFKSYYKKLISNRILFELDNEQNKNLSYLDIMKKITIYDALCLIHYSWNKVSVDTIKNSFNSAINNTTLENDKNTNEHESQLECLPFDLNLFENEDEFIMR